MLTALEHPNYGSSVIILALPPLILSSITKALVQVMETRVDKVRLGYFKDVTLDIKALLEYSGQGK